MSEANPYPQSYETQGESKPSAELQDASMGDYGAQAASSIAESGRQMSSFVGHLAEMARADAAVGPAQSVGGHTVVPLASVSVQAGFGLGFGGGGGTDTKRNQGGGSGGGGGGGGRGSARVIAVADISEHGVEVRPVPDVTALALAMMALIGLRMLSRRGSRPGSRRLLGMLRRE